MSLVGGKWTTFRALGEHLADEVLALLSRPRQVSTQALPIGGGKDFPRTEADTAAWVQRHGTSVGEDRARELLARYGTHAEAIINHLGSVGDQPLEHNPHYSVGEIESLIDNEWVVTLSDIVHRRTSMAFSGHVNKKLLKELAHLMASRRGWSSSEVARQIGSITVE